MTVEEMRRVRAETLLQLAKELDGLVLELEKDWVSVMLRAGTRARIKAFSEVAAMCRAAADVARDLPLFKRSPGAE